MSETIEIVRLTVSAENREAFLRGRPAAIAAIAEAFPGLLDARLAETDDGAWVDVVRWRSKAEADAAAAGCATIPVVRDWMATIEQVQDLSHATLRHAAAA